MLTPADYADLDVDPVARETHQPGATGKGGLAPKASQGLCAQQSPPRLGRRLFFILLLQWVRAQGLLWPC